MVAPPALLAILTVLFGVFPAWLGSGVAEATTQSIKLVLWPGFKPALAVSTIVVISGVVIYGVLRSVGADRLPTTRQLRIPTGANAYHATLRGLNATADVTTGIVQNGSLPVYLAVIMTSVLFIPAVTWFFNWDASPSASWWYSPAEVILAFVIIAGAIAATRAQRRMAAVLLLGVVGYAIAGVYVVFSAPDLAITQLLIESLTVALFALVLAKLPRRFGPNPRSLSTVARVGVSAIVGAFVTMAALMMTTVDPDPLTDIYLRESEEAGGTNVVNIILTNFRALDTLGEITVLAAAGVGITALVVSMRKRPEEETT